MPRLGSLSAGLAETLTPASTSDSGLRGKARTAGGWPASWFLLLIVALALLPSFLISSILLWQINENGSAQRQRELLSRARAMAHVVDQQIEWSITVLRVLASSDLLARSEYSRLHGRITRALEGRDAHILFLDSELNQLINTRVPYGTPLGKTSDPQSSLAAAERQGPYVSRVFFGQVAQTPVFNVVIPVIEGGQTRFYLIMTRNAEQLTPFLDRTQIPGASVVVLDQENQIVATSRNVDRQEAAPLIRALIGYGAPEGDVRTLAVDDTDYVYASARSELSGWRVIKYLPQAHFREPFDRSLMLLTGTTLLVLTMCILAALWVARQVTSSLQKLATAAHEPSEERFPRNAPIQEINIASEALETAFREREQNAEHVRVLMREMTHRVKNQFAVIEAIFRQTGQVPGSDEDRRKAFLARLHGLSRSTEALSRQDWMAASLRDLFHEHLRLFSVPGLDRVRFQGDDLRIKPGAAEALGLALHELATNSLKYGALSTDDGQIEIDWSCGGERSTFRLTWKELGGPPVTSPERKGFGSLVLDRIVANQLGGCSTLVYAPAGVIWRFECPCFAVVDKPPAEATG